VLCRGTENILDLSFSAGNAVETAHMAGQKGHSSISYYPASLAVMRDAGGSLVQLSLGRRMLLKTVKWKCSL